MASHVVFIGLGQMGQPMALNLLKAGIALKVFDLNKERLAPFDKDVQVSHLRDAIEPGSIVLTMVPDDTALGQVALGQDGILKWIGQGGIHLSLSTISPGLSQQLAALYNQQGSSYLAATVLGRPDVAARADLSIFLSGDVAAKECVLPLLHMLGKRIYDLGEVVTAANVVKLGANFLIVAALEAMGEAAMLVEHYGADREHFLHMMAESPLFSSTVYEGYGQMIGAQNYTNARFPVGMGIKDVDLILQAAKQANLPMQYAQIARKHLQAALAANRSQEDWSVLADFADTEEAPTHQENERDTPEKRVRERKIAFPL
jgi:3-hydroxyisobutyrate dehydrogenase-like beta-hydroxyacid dehydrogenase